MKSTYFRDIVAGITSTKVGLMLTLRHLWQAHARRTPAYVTDPNYFGQDTGVVTLTYPHEQLPLPDNARYQLHNEMDDCIVCDKCAKICPVDCIEIEPIRSSEEIGKASDGSSIRLYAAKFDIDMAKCCFCGLCTTVCPTECLTMTHEYDFSSFDVRDMLMPFANLTAVQADEKRELWTQYQIEKEEFKKAEALKLVVQVETETTAETVAPLPKRPVFRPGAKPSVAVEVPEPPVAEVQVPKRPAFRPGMKPKE